MGHRLVALIVLAVWSNSPMLQACELTATFGKLMVVMAAGCLRRDGNQPVSTHLQVHFDTYAHSTWQSSWAA